MKCAEKVRNPSCEHFSPSRFDVHASGFTHHLPPQMNTHRENSRRRTDDPRARVWLDRLSKTIPILTIILNNSALGGYEHHMPIATKRFGTKFLSGDYAKVAEGLGGYSERVENPADIIPAIHRAQKEIDGGKPALLEVITREEGAFSRGY